VLNIGKVPVMSETSVLKMLGANHISGIQFSCQFIVENPFLPLGAACDG